ncbi:MAG: FCD domain-containing protein [Acidobacteriota bacterium]
MKEIPAFAPLTRENLSDQVSGRLLEMLSSQALRPGDRLPPEPDLCRQLGVGRSTLREGIRSLVFLGVLQPRAGEGTFVAGNTGRMLDGVLLSGLLQSRKEIDELCEARMVLETELSSLCAERATEDDLVELRHLAAGMERDDGISTEEFVGLDLSFHLALATAAKNEILMQLLRATRGLLQEWIIRSQRVEVARAVAKSGHERILGAIERRDAAAARQAMAEHLRGSFELLKKSTELGA